MKMGKAKTSKVGVKPVEPIMIMGEGEAVPSSFDKPGQYKPASGQSKSASALLSHTPSSMSFGERIRSALRLSKSKGKTQKTATLESESEQVSPPSSTPHYLMDMGLDYIQNYRPKEGTYGKDVSVRGFKKGVREFGELLMHMCVEDILAYQSDCKFPAVPSMVVTPCSEEAKPALLVSSVDIN